MKQTDGFDNIRYVWLSPDDATPKCFELIEVWNGCGMYRYMRDDRTRDIRELLYMVQFEPGNENYVMIAGELSSVRSMAEKHADNFKRLKTHVLDLVKYLPTWRRYCRHCDIGIQERVGSWTNHGVSGVIWRCPYCDQEDRE